MSKFYTAITMAALCFRTPGAAAANITRDIVGDNYTISGNTYIADTATLDITNIYISETLYLHNTGRIMGTFYLCPGCDAYIQNSGDILGAFIRSPDSKVVQLIESRDDLTRLSSPRASEIFVRNTTDIKLSDLANLGTSYDTITIQNASLIYSPELKISHTIHLLGENTLILAGIPSDISKPLLQNITSDGGAIKLNVPGSGKLFTPIAYIRNGNLYMRLARETDYYKILNSQRGVFLNRLRQHNPDDKLLRALDSAPNMAALNHIMSKSMRLNPNLMRQPLLSFNRRLTAMQNTMPLNLTTFGMFGDRMSAYGAQAGARPTGGLTMSVHAAQMQFTDGIDDYSANLYGGSIGLRKGIKEFVFDAHAYATLADFVTPPMESGHHPFGLATGGTIDIGYRFDIIPSIQITPFAGWQIEYANITKNYLFSTARAGLSTEYTTGTSDMTYKYGLDTDIRPKDIMHATARISVTSPADAVTVTMYAGISHDEMGQGATIGCNAQFTL